MQQPIEDGGGQGAVIVEYLGPILEGSVRGHHDRSLFIAQADDLEEQIGTGLVNGEVAELVQYEQRGFGVLFEFRFETTGTLGGSQGVDDINGAGKEHRVALETRGIA